MLSHWFMLSHWLMLSHWAENIYMPTHVCRILIAECRLFLWTLVFFSIDNIQHKFMTIPAQYITILAQYTVYNNQSCNITELCFVSKYNETIIAIFCNWFRMKCACIIVSGVARRFGARRQGINMAPHNIKNCINCITWNLILLF